ncbi:hypothetical protein GCU56_10650 [Geodermatophilus sabuli]|uniref:Uncharacterized protein n=1 Tax=Geodermatophilus sabuli TaxID=1564158 RepID=A0A7K3W0Z2_9ACTN|nr:hypothetical protein [Geodermatophilus sabuli]NEK58330.1 hypothetical protein [Geodermatophilus sabuli]
MSADTDLRDRLHRLAETTAPPPRDDLASAVAARHRRLRRQRAALGAVAALVAAVVVAVPAGLGGPAVEPAPAAPAAGPDTSGDLPAAAVYTAPTRGSLAGDAAFVEGVLRLPWTRETLVGAGLPNPPQALRHVVFAGDVAGGRWALVAGPDTTVPQDTDPARQTDLGALGDVAVAWFVGPPGATPAQLELSSVPYGVDPRSPSALADTTTGAVVVVAAPGDTVQVSLRPEVAADGTVSRTWMPVDAPDGVAVLDVGRRDAAHDQALLYRVDRDGEQWVSGADGHVDPSHEAPRPDVRWLRAPAPASPADVMLGSSIESVLASSGLPVDEVDFTVLWNGDVPAPGATPGRVTLLAATLPSGAVHLTAEYALAMDDGAVGGTWCGTGFRPAGPPLADQTYIVRCDATDMSEGSEVVSSLIVVAPAAATTARLVDDRGGELSRHPLADGVAVVPMPDPGEFGSVEVLAADGRSLAWTKVLGTATWDG